MTIFNVGGGGGGGGDGSPTFKEMTTALYEIKASDWGGHYTQIPQYYFAYDDLLASIEIPQGVTRIGNYAFYYCTSLASITIPQGVTSIGNNAFRSIGTDTAGSVITMLDSTPPTLTSNAFQSAYIKKIIVPQGSLTAYQTATNWSAYAQYMEEAP